MIKIFLVISLVAAQSIAESEANGIQENPNQQWVIKATGTNNEGLLVEIRNVLSDKCVDNWYSNLEGGNPIQQYHCNQGDSKRWLIFGNERYFSIRNIRSRKCITVTGDSSADGAKIVQKTCDSILDSQKWTFDQGRLVNKLTEKCLDKTNSNEAEVQLIQWTCN